MNDDQSAGSSVAALSGVGEFHARESAACRAALERVPPVLGTTPQYVGLVRPGSAAELAAVVGQARARGWGMLRLYNGSNVGARLMGDGEVLIVDLARMNRILEVNVEYAYARVEPGVSFAALAAHLERNRMPLLVDSERDPAASVAGSLFSKGIGHTAYADHTLVQCGAEYVLPDGSLMRTGMGAMPDNRTWQLYKYALGPYADGLAVQSDLMLPTQTGIWLMGQVPAYREFAVDLADDAALAAGIEALRPLKIANVLPGTVTLAHRDFDAARSGQAARAAAWRLQGALYGLPRVVELTMPAVQAAFAGIPGAGFVAAAQLAGDPLWREQSALMSGRPGIAAPVFRDPQRPQHATLAFAALLEGEAAVQMLGVAREAVADAGLALLVELSVPARALLLTVYLPYRRDDAASLVALDEATRALVAGMGRAGFGLVRESVELGRLAATLVDSGGLATLRRRITEAFAGGVA